MLLGVATNARANGGRTGSLTWVELPGAKACGGAMTIVDAVKRRVGRPALVSPPHAEFSIEGRVERKGTRLRAVLVLRDSAGVQLGIRRLESDTADCSELRENVALAISLMLDADDPEAPQAVTPEPDALAPDAKAVEHGEAPGKVAATRSFQVVPAVDATVGYGFLPAISPGARASTMLLLPRFWPVELYGGVWAPQTVPVQHGASTRFASTFGGLGLCPLNARSGPVFFRTCALGQLGVVVSEPAGFAVVRGGSLPTVHLLGNTHFSIIVAHGVAADVGASLGFALLGSRFVFENSAGTQPLFDSPRLAALADLGLSVTLP